MALGRGLIKVAITRWLVTGTRAAARSMEIRG